MTLDRAVLREYLRRMRSKQLPRTPRDVFRFRWWERALYGLTLGIVRILGVWRYPWRAYGDVERMRFIDKAYWLWKTTNPIRFARRGSGLEKLFEEQRAGVSPLLTEFRGLDTLRVTAAGDLLSHPYLARSADTLYEQVEDLIFDAEVSMANLECPIVPESPRAMAFAATAPPLLSHDRATFNAVKGFRGRHFTFLATACNHSLDCGTEGLESTIATLREEGIAFHGTCAEADASDRAVVLFHGAFRIGVVAYTFGLNGMSPPADRPWMVHRMRLNDGSHGLDRALIATHLHDCRQRGVNFVVAQLHWGMEHEFYPSPEQREVAHELAELGMDAIIGHHPHVIQPVEYYRTSRDPRRIVPIWYSLGNLVNIFSAPYLCRSTIARLTLARGFAPEGEERVYVQRAESVEVIQEILPAERKLCLRRVSSAESTPVPRAGRARVES
jgi:poly-gamma-glutamate synthesis protein (capsule biosynthesis protein)